MNVLYKISDVHILSVSFERQKENLVIITLIKTRLAFKFSLSLFVEGTKLSQSRWIEDQLKN